MLPRALNLLRCPECFGKLHVANKLRAEPATLPSADGLMPCAIHGQRGSGPCAECFGEEIELGLLACPTGHRYPIIAGVPRMELEALGRFRDVLLEHKSALAAEELAAVETASREVARAFGSTRTSFSLEWALWKPGDKTWIWSLEERKRVFAEDVQLQTLDRHEPRVVLDAGCGNGQLSAGMSTFGFEVYACDLSSSVERAHQIKRDIAGDAAHRLHYIQTNLARPPFAPDTFDIVYSSGVLHHTPNTESTFKRVFPLCKPGGRGYVWLYSATRKPLKRALSQALRVVTVRMPPDVLRVLCEVAALPINGVTSVLTKAGIRETAPRSTREMAVSLFDEFSPRYAFHHREDEVEAWYRSLGFSQMSVCSVDRNGFGMRAIRAA